MTFKPNGSTVRYVELALERGTLTPRDISFLVAYFQEDHAQLVEDGKPGPRTIEALRSYYVIPKIYPLSVLPDGRLPTVTSGFKTKNPSRPNHDGCDFFYRYDPTIDPPVKQGDGGATTGADGKPKWFIPSGIIGSTALAAADGVVSEAGNSKTGWRCWVDHGDGMRTGYFHLRELSVQKGDHVRLGDALGRVGDNPADIDAQHLHFEVSPIGTYQPTDPEVWLQGATYFKQEIPF
jgi:murein DD-endopeptidase MepM/ murein hydrolase activator NlpD